MCAEYYVKLEGIMHNAKDAMAVATILGKLIEKIHEQQVDITHTETAMILPNGDIMSYEVADHNHDE